jgi:hypothetical protein
MNTREELRQRQQLLDELRVTGHPDALAQAERLQTHYHYGQMAAISADAYQSAAREGQPPLGWKRLSEHRLLLDDYAARMGMDRDRLLDYLKPDDSGFRAELYIPDPQILGPSYQPVLAFKGSAGSVRYADGTARATAMEDFLANNFPQAVGLKTDYYDRAMRVALLLKDSQVEFDITGHSLGGGMASAAAAVTGNRTVTINAAGLHPITAQRFATENGGLPTYDTRQSVTSLQVVDEMLNPSLQTALHRMQAGNRDELAGLIREMSDMASDAPAVRELLKTALGEQLPPHARPAVGAFVDALSGPDAERLWRDVPMAAGRWEPLLDAKQYADPGQPGSAIVDRPDRPNAAELAFLAGPAFKVLQQTARGARTGEALGETAVAGSAVMARALDTAGDTTRTATERGAEVSQAITQTVGGLSRSAVRNAGEAAADAREWAGEVEAGIDRAQGGLQRAGANAGGVALRGIGRLDLLPDGVQRWAQDQADRLQHGGADAYRRNQEEAQAALREAAQAATHLRSGTEERLYHFEAIEIRAVNTQRRAIEGSGALVDDGLDMAAGVTLFNGQQVKQGLTATGALLGGGLGSAQHLSPLDPDDYPNILRTQALPGAVVMGGYEGFNRHLMDVAQPSIEARIDSEETQARGLLRRLSPARPGQAPAQEEDAPQRTPQAAAPTSDPGIEAHQRLLDALSRDDRQKYTQCLSHARTLGLTDQETQCLALGMTEAMQQNRTVKRIDGIAVTPGAAGGGDGLHLMFKPHGDKDPIFNTFVDVAKALATPPEQTVGNLHTLSQARALAEYEDQQRALAQQADGPAMTIGPRRLDRPGMPPNEMMANADAGGDSVGHSFLN